MKLLSAAILLAAPAFASAAPEYYFLRDKPAAKPARPAPTAASPVRQLGEHGLVFDRNSVPANKRHSVPHRLLQDAHRLAGAKGKSDDSFPGSNPRIVDGDDAEFADRPYQVSLQNVDWHFCGGAVIDDRWILTAAHCLAGTTWGEPVRVVTGVADLTDPAAVTTHAVSLNTHPDYDGSTVDNDVALLMLADPLPESVARLPLITHEQMDIYALPGTFAEVSGWGNTDPILDLFPSILQTLETTLLDQTECDSIVRDFYNDVFGVSDNMICTGSFEPTPSPCYGDSGGPLTTEIDGADHSIGVVSWGPGNCGLENGVSVYSRVSQYLEWIETTKANAVVQAPQETTPLPEWLQLEDLAAEAGSTQYFTFDLPTPAVDLNITFTAASGSVATQLFHGVYMTDDAKVCDSQGESAEQSCRLSLAVSGAYTIAVTALEDYTGGELTVNFGSPELVDGSRITGINMPRGQVVWLYTMVTEPNQNLEVRTGDGTGDLDLVVLQRDSNDFSYHEICGGYNAATNEEYCHIENATPEEYLILLQAYDAVDGATLEVDLTDAPVVEPALPRALCQHSVVAQVGNGFMSAITITNTSDEYISDWYVEWDYGLPVTIDNMLNGILTGMGPFRAESPEPGRAISPGAMTTIYVFGTSESGLINNPVITGNFCR